MSEMGKADCCGLEIEDGVDVLTDGRPLISLKCVTVKCDRKCTLMKTSPRIQNPISCAAIAPMQVFDPGAIALQ